MPRSPTTPFAYSVPTGTTAVSGQVISSSAYNNFLSDLVNNALNAAFPITYGGTGTTDGSVLVPDGSAATPGMRFQQETNTGAYRAGAGDYAISILGTKRLDLTATGLNITGTISSNGSPIGTALSNDPFYNLSLSVTVAANALTIALKGADGNDPSATNPVIVNFRSATASSGLSSQLTITAATSLVVPSGATLGTSNNISATIAITAFNDAGTFRLGIINGGVAAQGISSSTTISAGATSANTFYTGTGVASKAYTVLCYIVITEVAAGTWASAPTTVQLSNVVPTISVVRTQVFTSNGTYTPNANMIYCKIYALGAGGGGGGVAGSTGSSFGAGGGGAGSLSTLIATKATIGASQTVTIGSLGSGGLAGANNGSAGTDTSVGTLCIGKGGSGGASGSSGGPGAGAAGGVQGTGDVAGTGQPGTSGNYLASASFTIAGYGGSGGSTIFGGGGKGQTSINTATAGGIIAAGSYGAGGAGASCGNSASNGAGSNGGSGLVIIEEFCTA